MTFCFLHIGCSGGAARNVPSDNHTVCSQELNRLSCNPQTNIRSNSMGRMFFLYVGPNLHVRGSDHAAVAQQLRCRCLNQTFVSHVRVCKAFCADEIQPGSMGNG